MDLVTLSLFIRHYVQIKLHRLPRKNTSLKWWWCHRAQLEDFHPWSSNHFPKVQVIHSDLLVLEGRKCPKCLHRQCNRWIRTPPTRKVLNNKKDSTKSLKLSTNNSVTQCLCGLLPNNSKSHGTRDDHECKNNHRDDVNLRRSTRGMAMCRTGPLIQYVAVKLILTMPAYTSKAMKKTRHRKVILHQEVARNRI